MSPSDSPGPGNIDAARLARLMPMTTWKHAAHFNPPIVAGAPAIERFLPPEQQSNYVATLEELINLELELSWKAAGTEEEEGRPTAPLVEGYLTRFPCLNQPEVVRRLLQQEYRVRHAYADRTRRRGLPTRFPDLDLKDTVLADFSGAGDPTVADLAPIAGYEILSLIGRGETRRMEARSPAFIATIAGRSCNQFPAARCWYHPGGDLRRPDGGAGARRLRG